MVGGVPAITGGLWQGFKVSPNPIHSGIVVMAKLQPGSCSVRLLDRLNPSNKKKKIRKKKINKSQKSRTQLSSGCGKQHGSNLTLEGWEH